MRTILNIGGSAGWSKLVRRRCATLGPMALRLPRDYRETTWTEVRRSRFGCTLARVDSEDAARAVVTQARRAWADARHPCSAVIGEVADARPVERSSDDGEPAGTAGTPMLAALRGADLTRVVAVVTRYFGGVLLGTGGLVRAYTDAVVGALDAAPRVEAITTPVFRFDTDLADAGRVHSDLAARGLGVLDVAYGDRAHFRVAASDRDALAGPLAAALRADVEVLDAGVTVEERRLP